MVGSTLPTPRSTPAWFCTSCCHFDGCFRFLLCLPSVCSVASYIQYLIHWLLCRTPFTRITFQNMAFSKAVLNMAFSKTLVYTHMLWFKLKPWFEQNQCFCVRVQTIFYTKSCFTQKLCYPRTPCFTQKPCSCWACSRAICSLQDLGGTRRRRLNSSILVLYVPALANWMLLLVPPVTIAQFSTPNLACFQ